MTKTKAAPTYHCAMCGRKLKDGRWVYSRHTGNRYCLPGNPKCGKSEFGLGARTRKEAHGK